MRAPRRQRTELLHRPALNTLYFYLTEGCNLACRHCWLAPRFDPDGDRYPALPVELFETAIREAKPLGLTGVKLTGGEPLLHPEIVQLLEIVRREELGLTIETNGVLCTPELAAEIAKIAGPLRIGQHGRRRRRDARMGARRRGSFDGSPGRYATWWRPASGRRSSCRSCAAMPDRWRRWCGWPRRWAPSVKFNMVQPSGRGERFAVPDGRTGWRCGN